MFARTETYRGLARTLALLLALTAVVFLLEVTPHGHGSAQEESVCRFCQVAHVGVAPAVAAVYVAVPFTPVGQVAVPALAPESISSNSFILSRAPPSP